MKKLFIGILLGGIALSLGIFIWQANSGHLDAREITPAELKQIIDRGGDFYVYFYSDTCPDCIKAEPKVARAVKIAKVNIVKLNVRIYQETKKELQIPGTPTIFHYNDRKLVSGITGDFPTYNKYVDYFQKAGADK